MENIQDSKLYEENEQLKRSLYFCQLAVKKAKMQIAQAPESAKGIINDCFLTVAANSPSFMGEPIEKGWQDEVNAIFKGWQKSDTEQFQNI